MSRRGRRTLTPGRFEFPSLTIWHSPIQCSHPWSWRAAGRSRHDVLSLRLGRPQSVEGAIVRYRATIAERDVELEVDDATGAVLRSSVRRADGSLIEARHSFVQNANGDLVKVSSRFSSGGGTSGEARRVMSVTYSNVVIR